MNSRARDVVTFPNGANLAVVSGPVADHEEHWDPKGSGNPLLDTTSTETLLAPNFSVGELARSGGQRFDVARIDPEFVRCLQALRDHVGAPVRVTSGYRSWGYNEKIYERRGKKPTLSRHCCGQAADVRISGMDGMAIAKATLDAYGRDIGVGIGSDFAHIDVRGHWARWTYLGRRANKLAITEIDAYRRSLPTPASPGDRPGPPSGPADLDLAVRRNRHHGDALGWAAMRVQIDRLVGIASPAPSEEELAIAVSDWQRRQGLEPDGIIGPITWARMQGLLPRGDDEPG